MDEKNRLKHVEHLTEINEMRKVASCWLYSANILAMHGPMNVELKNIVRNKCECRFCCFVSIFVKKNTTS